MRNEKRIVITGIGPVCSCGIGKDEMWRNMIEGRINLRKEDVSAGDDLWASFCLHKVDNFDVNKFGIDKEKLNDIKEWKEGEEIVDLNYFLACIKLALDDSGIDYHQENNGLGVVLAHENIGLMPFGLKVSNLAYDTLIGKKKDDISRKDFLDKSYKSFLKSGYDIQTFADLFHVTRTFNISNYSLFINNACASGLYTLESASQVIRSGLAKAVVVSACDWPEAYKYIWFRDLGVYADDGLVKPFCRDAKGLVFGDGGVAFVLEDMDSALKRKASIYAEYLGGGFNLEGWKITVPQLGSKSYQSAINQALERSGVKKEEIDLLCPHGVGYPVIDYYEAQAISDVFGSYPSSPLISVFKPYLGHNLGGSTLLESAALLLSLKNDTVLPALNCDNPDPRFKISLVQEMTRKELKTVMKICCAFAGFNAAAVFRKI